MIRRDMLKAALAAPLSFLLGMKAKPAEGSSLVRTAYITGLAPLKPLKEAHITIPIQGDFHPLWQELQDIRNEMAMCHAFSMARPEIKGVLGETYFKCGVRPSISEVRLRCFFNGEDVHCRAMEADAVAGWIVLHDVDAAGKLIPRTSHVEFGVVEFRPTSIGLHVDWPEIREIPATINGS